MLACTVRLSYCNNRAETTEIDLRSGTSFMFHYRPPLLFLLLSDAWWLLVIGIDWNFSESSGLHTC